MAPERGRLVRIKEKKVRAGRPRSGAIRTSSFCKWAKTRDLQQEYFAERIVPRKTKRYSLRHVRCARTHRQFSPPMQKT
jgi:hypothetical protein